MEKYKIHRRYDIGQINEARRLSGLKEIKTKRRVCLSCEKEFASEGDHNRLCDSCRKSDTIDFIYS